MQSDELAASLVRLAAVDEPVRAALREILLVSEGGSNPPPDLPGAGSGGNGGGMEPRIAKLEAHMEQVKDSLAKLSDVPSDLATLKERSTHLATKLEVSDMGNSIGARVQRNMYIIAGSIGVLTLVLKFVPV